MTTNDGYIHDADGNLIPDPDAPPSKSTARGRALYEELRGPKKRRAPSPSVAALVKRFPHSRH